MMSALPNISDEKKTAAVSACSLLVVGQNWLLANLGFPVVSVCVSVSHDRNAQSLGHFYCYSRFQPSMPAGLCPTSRLQFCSFIFDLTWLNMKICHSLLIELTNVKLQDCATVHAMTIGTDFSAWACQQARKCTTPLVSWQSTWKLDFNPNYPHHHHSEKQITVWVYLNML